MLYVLYVFFLFTTTTTNLLHLPFPAEVRSVSYLYLSVCLSLFCLSLCLYLQTRGPNRTKFLDRVNAMPAMRW